MSGRPVEGSLISVNAIAESSVARKLYENFSCALHVLFTAEWNKQSSTLLSVLSSSQRKPLELSNWYENPEQFDLDQNTLLHIRVGDYNEVDAMAVLFGCSESLPCFITLHKLDTGSLLIHSQIEQVQAQTILHLSFSPPLVNSRSEKALSLPHHFQQPRTVVESTPVPKQPIPMSTTTTTAAPEEFGRTIRAIHESGNCVRLFIGGDKTHCGKTSIALGVLGGLFRAGVPPSKLAYIKPATQCEAPDLINAWCQAHGVTHCEGANAPLVFFKGFTREFLNGNMGTSQSWIDNIEKAVHNIAMNKSFVVIDGVGFPAVGSVVGVSNAEVAQASQAPVLLVGKCGVGGAIDAYSLNSSYFISKQVPVLGAVFNRGDVGGFYDFNACRESIELFFSNNKPREQVFGVVPELASLDGARESVNNMSPQETLAMAETCVVHVCSHLNLDGLMLATASDPWNRLNFSSSGLPPPPFSLKAAPSHMSASSTVQKKRSREEVEAEAAKKGAKGG